jgi:hypothetical protein
MSSDVGLCVPVDSPGGLFVAHRVHDEEHKPQLGPTRSRAECVVCLKVPVFSSPVALAVTRALLVAQGLFAIAFPVINFAFLFLPMGFAAALLGPIYMAAFVPPFSFLSGPVAIVASWRMNRGPRWPFFLGLAFEAVWIISPLQQLQISRLVPYTRGPGAFISLGMGLAGMVLILGTAIWRPRGAPPQPRAGSVSLRPLLLGTAGIALLLAAVIAVGLYLVFRNQGVSYTELISHPEARLYYPGSQVISARGTGEEQGLDVHTWASFTSALRTGASPAQILSWYERELEGRGWILRQADAYAVPSRVFTLGRREEMQVAISTDGTYSTTFTVLPVGCGDNDTTFHNCTGF